MNHDPVSRRTRRGYALIAILTLAALLVFNVDLIADWLRSHVDIVALVRETSGIRVGSPVWVEGVEVGRVTAIEFAPDATAPVAVSLRLEERARAAVRKASLAHTAKQRFIGEPTLRIGAGPGSSPPVESGDTLQPSDRPTPEELLERGLAFPASLDSLHQALGRLHGLVEQRRPDVARVVDRLGLATAEAEALRGSLSNGSLGRLLDDPTLPARIERLQRHAADIAEAVDRLEADTDGGEALRREVGAVSARAERLGTHLARLQRTLSEGNGLLPRMQRDSALAVAVAGVTAQVDSLRAAGLDFALRMFLP